MDKLTKVFSSAHIRHVCFLSIPVLSSFAPTVHSTNTSSTATVGCARIRLDEACFLSSTPDFLFWSYLCIWLALHLNIAPDDESLAQTRMRNFKWGLIGFVHLELVVLAA